MFYFTSPSVSGLPDYMTSIIIRIVYTIAVTVVKSAFVIPSKCAYWRGNLEYTPEIATGGNAARGNDNVGNDMAA